MKGFALSKPHVVDNSANTRLAPRSKDAAVFGMASRGWPAEFGVDERACQIDGRACQVDECACQATDTPAAWHVSSKEWPQSLA